MLKKLKNRFIVINMLSVGTVVILIFCVICGFTYKVQKNEIDKTLQRAVAEIPPGVEAFPDRAEPDGKDGAAVRDNASVTDVSNTSDDGNAVDGNDAGKAPDSGPRGVLPSENDRVTDNPRLDDGMGNAMIPTVTVTVGKDGEMTVRENGATIGDQTLIDALSAANESKSDSGELRSLGLFFLKSVRGDVSVTAFASSERMYSTVKSTAVIAGAVCLCSLGVFLFISVMLSRLAVRPVAEAWNRQRRFVADASHDLKTPLTVIIANTEIVASHRDESVATQMKWIESTREEATRMRRLAERLLELAKTEDMSEGISLKNENLSELTEKTVLQFEPVAFERQVSIYSDCGENITAEADAESFVRMLHILIDNAVKYAAENTTVTVRLGKVGKATVLSVNNRGDVISKEDLSHIFERFYRADRSRNTEGFGLGLSIARNLAAAQGGVIKAESNAESGTTFTVTFG